MVITGSLQFKRDANTPNNEWNQKSVKLMWFRPNICKMYLGLVERIADYCHNTNKSDVMTKTGNNRIKACMLTKYTNRDLTVLCSVWNLNIQRFACAMIQSTKLIFRFLHWMMVIGHRRNGRNNKHWKFRNLKNIYMRAICKLYQSNNDGELIN